MVKGLWESVSGEWAADIDLNDGKLTQLYKQYQDKIVWAKSIGLQDQSIEQTKQELMRAQDIITADIEFVLTGMCNIIVHEGLLLNGS